MHTPYHCRFLTERPTFHPRRFFFLPIGQSVSIFNAVLPSEPCTGGLSAAWKRSGTTANRACAATHCACVTRPSYIYKGRYPRRGQSVLARFRSGDDRSVATTPWPCFRASLRDTISGEINDRRERKPALYGVK